MGGGWAATHTDGGDRTTASKTGLSEVTRGRAPRRANGGGSNVCVGDAPTPRAFCSSDTTRRTRGRSTGGTPQPLPERGDGGWPGGPPGCCDAGSMRGNLFEGSVPGYDRAALAAAEVLGVPVHSKRHGGLQIERGPLVTTIAFDRSKKGGTVPTTGRVQRPQRTSKRRRKSCQRLT